MRVISGSAKGHRLEMYDGRDTRPTTDKTKESLFAMLQFEIQGTRFLDLYAGSGAIAIEALSRGASSAVLVESASKAAACIRRNLIKTGFQAQSSLYVRDVFSAIEMLQTQQDPFDIIFMDPPYHRNLENKTLACIMEAGILKDGGLAVIESSSQTEIAVPDQSLTIEKERVYGITKLTFLRYMKDGES